MPKEWDSDYSRGTCTPMFIAALFTISKSWKHSRYPNTDQRVKKIWYLYTMEFYSAMRKNEILSFASKWMKLENIILREEAKNHMFSLIHRLRSKRNAIILLHVSHAKGRTHTEGLGKGRKPKT
jgi:hypothetical protein